MKKSRCPDCNAAEREQLQKYVIYASWTVRVRRSVSDSNIIRYKKAMIVPTKLESNTELIAMLGKFAGVRWGESARLTAVCV
jgi:hypothetical protein